MCLLKKKIVFSTKNAEHIYKFKQILCVFKNNTGKFCIYPFYFSGKFKKENKQEIPLIYYLDIDKQIDKKAVYWHILPINDPRIFSNFLFITWFPEEKSRDAFTWIFKLNNKEE